MGLFGSGRKKTEPKPVQGEGEQTEGSQEPKPPEPLSGAKIRRADVLKIIDKLREEKPGTEQGG